MIVRVRQVNFISRYWVADKKELLKNNNAVSKTGKKVVTGDADVVSFHGVHCSFMSSC